MTDEPLQIGLDKNGVLAYNQLSSNLFNDLQPSSDLEMIGKGQDIGPVNASWLLTLNMSATHSWRRVGEQICHYSAEIH